MLGKRKLGFGSQTLPLWPVAAAGRRVRDYLRLKESLRKLLSATKDMRDFEDLFEAIAQFPDFRSDQKRGEIIPLLNRLATNPPRSLCEIGTAYGGTLFMLARACAPDATIISVDLGLPIARALLYPRMAVRQQRIICLRCDSRSQQTVQRIQRLLEMKSLDCLFIDGDHSLQAVTDDFSNYAPLVRAEGAIVLHDIVMDYRTRFGIETSAATGSVPKFWDSIKSGLDVEEFIELTGQDGYGLGLIHWQPSQG